MRRQHYWTNLSGACGGVFGNYPVWQFEEGWDSDIGINSPGHYEMQIMTGLFTSHKWWTLVPDLRHNAVTAGYGTYGSGDYVTAARADDGSLIMAYLPSTGTVARTLQLDMSQLSGPATAQWFNPTTGEYTLISDTPLPNAGSLSFTTPGDNGTGTNDWVLVLHVPEPGTLCLSSAAVIGLSVFAWKHRR